MSEAAIILAFLDGLILGAFFARAERPKSTKHRKVEIKEKAPHFYDLRAE